MSPRRRPGSRGDSDLALAAIRRKRRRQRLNRRKRFGRLVVSALLGLLLVLVVTGFTGAAVWMSSCNLDTLRPVNVGENSFVYAADGSLLGSIPAEKNRQPVKLNRISKWMRLSTIAIEDRRFYEHSGIDLEGIARALAADVRAGKVVEGGSTITQQLVRNLYISREVTFERKLIEACLAVRLNN